MKITIIPIDGAVYKDGVSYAGLDLSVAPTDVHALQFNDVTNKGWIEFIDDDFGIKSPNELITELPVWAVTASAKWEQAKAAEEAAIESARLAAIAAEEARLAAEAEATNNI